MKTLATTLVLALGLAGPAAADPVLGLWQTEVDDGAYAYIDRKPCGAALCGIIARTFNASGEYQSENLGKTLVIDMVPAGGGH